MGRTLGFDGIIRALRLATVFEDRGISTRDGLARAAVARKRQYATRAAAVPPGATRRDILKGIGATAAIGLLGVPRIGRATPRANASVGIVGAGLAGLSAADSLAAAGIAATIYEGRDRIGGRQWSMGGSFSGPVMFPGQVVERGGELIDTTHITMKKYAKRFGLKLEDVRTKEWLPGEVTYFFDGARVPEEVIVDHFRALVDALRPTLAATSPGTHTATSTSSSITRPCARCSRTTAPARS